jgi:hypothetical protein
MSIGRAATLAGLLVGLSACGASDGPAASSPVDVIEHSPSIAMPCEDEADCASGICVPDLCPLTLPEASFCGREAEPGNGGCAPDEECVDAAKGKYAQSCPSEDLETVCVPLAVCADALVAGGVRCERDWECESGDCIGIQCETPPDAFAFGQLRVCASSRCALPRTGSVTPLGECAASTSCSGPGAPYVSCVASACPEAYSVCEADPECQAILTCVSVCPESGFWSCLDDCMVSVVPCAPGEEERRAPQVGICYCVPDDGCG